MRMFRTGGLVIASLAVASLAISDLAAGPAWAKKASFTCTGLHGNVFTDSATLTGCGGNTGGSGSLPPSALANGSGTITWANSTSTSVAITVKQLKKEHGCPSTAYTEFKVKGKTTADTTGSAPVGSKVKGKACANLSTGDLVAPAGGTFQV